MVEGISTDSAATLFSLLQDDHLLVEKLYMIGQKGFDLGRGKIRVILRPKKRLVVEGVRVN